LDFPCDIQGVRPESQIGIPLKRESLEARSILFFELPVLEGSCEFGFVDSKDEVVKLIILTSEVIFVLGD
jgi:hypothetical protein